VKTCDINRHDIHSLDFVENRFLTITVHNEQYEVNITRYVARKFRLHGWNGNNLPLMEAGTKAMTAVRARSSQMPSISLLAVTCLSVDLNE
jgi:hypothetical protein